MSSVPHPPLTPGLLRQGRALHLLSIGLLTGLLSGCSMWPQALPWSSDDAPPPPLAHAVPPQSAQPMGAEITPQSSPHPVSVSTADTAPLPPQPAILPVPIIAPPEPATTTQALIQGDSKAKGKTILQAGATHHASAKATAPTTSSGHWVPGFYINVGIFALPSNGTKAFRTLEKANMPVFTDVVKTKKGPLTRVRVGPYLSKALADTAADKIKGMKLEAAVFQH